jgi:phage baseplate assembly protein gpV
MIRFAIIKNTIKPYLVKVLGLGGVTENRFISPKGLFSKPINEKAIVLNLSSGTNQDVVMALQKDIKLEDGDVYLTDDKSFIHYHYATGDITMQTKKLKVITDETTFDTKKFTVNTDDFALNSKTTSLISDTTEIGGSITNDGTAIDNTHDHTQTAGDHFGAGGITTPPNS